MVPLTRRRWNKAKSKPRDRQNRQYSAVFPPLQPPSAADTLSWGKKGGLYHPRLLQALPIISFLRYFSITKRWFSLHPRHWICMYSTGHYPWSMMHDGSLRSQVGTFSVKFSFPEFTWVQTGKCSKMTITTTIIIITSSWTLYSASQKTHQYVIHWVKALGSCCTAVLADARAGYR